LPSGSSGSSLDGVKAPLARPVLSIVAKLRSRVTTRALAWLKWRLGWISCQQYSASGVAQRNPVQSAAIRWSWKVTVMRVWPG
jgi:hypothetical protein